MQCLKDVPPKNQPIPFTTPKHWKHASNTFSSNAASTCAQHVHDQLKFIFETGEIRRESASMSRNSFRRGERVRACVVYGANEFEIVRQQSRTPRLREFGRSDNVVGQSALRSLIGPPPRSRMCAPPRPQDQQPGQFALCTLYKRALFTTRTSSILHTLTTHTHCGVWCPASGTEFQFCLVQWFFCM